MPTGKVIIINKLGLHARAAAKLVNLASSFNSGITLSHRSNRVDGKSIMGIMMLAAAKGTEIEVHTQGEDSEKALTAIMDLINDKFGEEE